MLAAAKPDMPENMECIPGVPDMIVIIFHFYCPDLNSSWSDNDGKNGKICYNTRERLQLLPDSLASPPPPPSAAAAAAAAAAATAVAEERDSAPVAPSPPRKAIGHGG